jgi:hypothetical protein
MSLLQSITTEWESQKLEKVKKFKLMNFHGWEFLISTSMKISPHFSSQIAWRVHNKLATNIAVTGEPGIGKSYDACDMARINEGLTMEKVSKGKVYPAGLDRFSVDQVVFRQSDYLELLPKLNIGKAIVFDEPSYALGKRDWFKELQKVLVHTLESQRFLIHPLFVPIINLALLDKTIRSYLIQFVCHVMGRGHTMVYRVLPSQRTEKIYWYQQGELYYRMFDNELCSEDSCLGCKKLDDCKVFRAQYERKKRSIQFERYEQGREQAMQKESQDLTEKQIEDIMVPVLDDMLTERGKLDVSKMRLHLREMHGISITSWKAYNIKRNLENKFKEKFEQ